MLAQPAFYLFFGSVFYVFKLRFFAHTTFKQRGFDYSAPNTFLNNLRRTYEASETVYVYVGAEFERDNSSNVNKVRIGLNYHSQNIRSGSGNVEGSLNAIIGVIGLRREMINGRIRPYGMLSFNTGFIISPEDNFTYTYSRENQRQFSWTESRFLTGHEAEIGFRRIYNEKSSGIIGLRVSSLRRSLPQGAAHTQIIFGPVFGYAFAL